MSNEDLTPVDSPAAVEVDDAPQALEKAVEHKAIGAGLLFPWNKAYAGNGVGLFKDLDEVMKYIVKQHRGVQEERI